MVYQTTKFSEIAYMGNLFRSLKMSFSPLPSYLIGSFDWVKNSRLEVISFQNVRQFFPFLLTSNTAFEKSNAFVCDLLILSGSFYYILIQPSVLKFYDDLFFFIH